LYSNGFCSYTGEALDFKTPLLKSLTALDKAAVSVLEYFDKDAKKVFATLVWEQEYFLVDEALFNARPDLALCGRTLMGHAAAKDQQLEDHLLWLNSLSRYRFYASLMSWRPTN
jgi:glutamine synthetase